VNSFGLASAVAAQRPQLDILYVALFGAVVVGMSVTATRRLAGVRVRATRSRLESISALANDAIVVIDEAGAVVSWNAAAARMFGYEPVEVLGGTIWHMMPAGRDEDYAELFKKTMRDEITLPSTPVQIEVARRGGSTFPAELSVSVFAEGRRRFALVIFRDVSERKRTEAELRASMELNEGVLNAATEYSIIATDQNGVITVFNRGAERMLGYSAADVVGHKTAVLPHDAAELSARALELGLATGPDIVFGSAHEGAVEQRKWTYVRNDGSRLPVFVTVNRLVATDGSPRGYISIAHDLSAERRAKRRVAVANEAFRKAFESAPVAVILTRRDMSCLHANPAFCALTGFDASVLRTMSMVDLMVTDDESERAWRLDEFENLVQGRIPVHHGEIRVLRADGTNFWAAVHTSLIFDENQEPLIFITHLEDATQRLHAEAISRDLLVRKEEALDRLEELDRVKSDLVSVVSHELRTPVTSIVGYLELLTDSEFGALTSEQTDAVSIVQRNALRLEQLVADLMTASRLESGELEVELSEVIDVAHLVRQTTAAMLPLIARRRQRVQIEVEQTAGSVLGDERQLEAVLSNLLTNASKFTPENGEITVSTITTDNEVTVSVTDTGIGIEADELTKVFGRFYRGDRDEVSNVPGTGLGLSIVKGIVKQHKGRVWLESQVGAGTKVTVALPRLVQEPLVAAARGGAST
jgi:PAS domain S-box-containing protein